MPTPRLHCSYPPEFEAAFRAAMNSPFTIACSSPLEAKQQRFHLYAYRTAIRHEPLTAENRELKTIASLLSFKIKASAIIIYRPRKLSNIQQALNNVREPEPVTGTVAIGVIIDDLEAKPESGT
jgi:hypothetical protein